MPQVPILMPQLGESIAEATVVDIRVAVGESVSADQAIIEVETSKAIMEVTTPCSGTVLKITASQDVSYAVGAILGHLEISEEEAKRQGYDVDPGEPARGGQPSEADAGDTPDKTPAGVHFRSSEADSFVADTPEADQPTVKPTIEGLPVPANATGASYLSPRLKARMHELGLNASDLAGVPGSGSGGRVTVEDFENFLAELDKNKMSAASPMRIAVADSMRRSWTRPLATVGSAVTLDPILAHRKTAQHKPGPALYVIRALALAIAENTAIGGRLIGSQIVHPKAVDIGFAVEVPDGVLVPVIRDVDRKPLEHLVMKYDTLVQQARDRRLPGEAIGGGIATVTNYGTFGIVWATPIPLPEQNLVLGLGRGRRQPVWDDAKGGFVPTIEAEITLSFDHRVLDGGAAGRLLARVAELLQKPDDL